MYSEWGSQEKKPHHLVLHNRSKIAHSVSQQKVIAKFNSTSFNFTVVTSVIKQAVTQFPSNLQIKLL